MFARNGIHLFGIVIYAHVTALTLIRLVHCQTPMYYEHIGCLNNSSRCYAVHSLPAKDYQSASETCRNQHNGNLATIYDHSTQELLSGLLRNSGVDLSDDYWIGAQLELQNNWTWTDGTTYALNSSSEYFNPVLRGYASIMMSGKPPTLHLVTIPIDSYAKLRIQCHYALCQCKAESCRDKYQNEYFNVTASGWFDGRNSCIREGADLAVLTSSQRLDGIIQENRRYFVGLANVRLVWIQLTKTGNVVRRTAKYTNFDIRSPRGEDEFCVVLYPPTAEWNVAGCTHSKSFICEYTSSYVTQAATKFTDLSSRYASTTSTPSVEVVHTKTHSTTKSSMSIRPTIGLSENSEFASTTMQTDISQPAIVPALVGSLLATFSLCVIVVIAIICYVRVNFVRRTTTPGQTIDGVDGDRYQSLNMRQSAPTTNTLYEPIRNSDTVAAAVYDDVNDISGGTTRNTDSVHVYNNSNII